MELPPGYRRLIRNLRTGLHDKLLIRRVQVQEVNVNVSATGEVSVEAAGVRGAGCQALTRAIEEAIGRTTADQKKPEFFQQQAAAAGTVLGSNPKA